MPKPKHQPRKTVIIQARYLDEFPLIKFLVGLFGRGQIGVEWTRGYYQCTLPRGLKPSELEALSRKVAYEHYREI